MQTTAFKADSSTCRAAMRKAVWIREDLRLFLWHTLVRNTSGNRMRLPQLLFIRPQPASAASVAAITSATAAASVAVAFSTACTIADAIASTKPPNPSTAATAGRATDITVAALPPIATLPASVAIASAAPTNPAAAISTRF
mmetsp:Transcript_35449/g.68195  ORF Transcript_35449/g.68195 Transcript_35449/m.68195 type:complete len:142 (-) Transcript_35449:584-1009(-)